MTYRICDVRNRTLKEQSRADRSTPSARELPWSSLITITSLPVLVSVIRGVAAIIQVELVRGGKSGWGILVTKQGRTSGDGLEHLTNTSNTGKTSRYMSRGENRIRKQHPMIVALFGVLRASTISPRWPPTRFIHPSKHKQPIMVNLPRGWRNHCVMWQVWCRLHLLVVEHGSYPRSVAISLPPPHRVTRKFSTLPRRLLVKLRQPAKDYHHTDPHPENQEAE